MKGFLASLLIFSVASIMLLGAVIGQEQLETEYVPYSTFNKSFVELQTQINLQGNASNIATDKINKTVDAYLKEHPKLLDEAQIINIIDAYLKEHPQSLDEGQINNIVDAYLKEHPPPRVTATMNYIDFLKMFREVHGNDSSGLSTDKVNNIIAAYLKDHPQVPIPSPLVPPENPRLSIDPLEGYWSDMFTYIAIISSKNNNDYTLGLEIYHPGTKSWESLPDSKNINKGDYDINHESSATWRYQGFSESDAGNKSKARVYYYNKSAKMSLGEWIGPALLKPSINITGIVTPAKRSYNDYYDYIVNVTHSSKANMVLQLEIMPPGSKEGYLQRDEKRITTSSYIYDNNSTARVEWKHLKPFGSDDVNKNFSFKIYYQDDRQNGDNRTFLGPDIINHPPTIIDAHVSPRKGASDRPFIYNSTVKDIDGDDLEVSLNIIDQGKVVYTADPQPVRASDAKKPGGAKVEWKYQFEEVPSNRSYNFSIICNDGVQSVSKQFAGPNVRPPIPITVRSLKFDATGGQNWWDNYLMTMVVNNPSEDPAVITPFVSIEGTKIPLESKEAPPGSSYLPLNWTFSPFGPQDRFKSFAYGYDSNLLNQNGKSGEFRNWEQPISDTLMPWWMVAINLIMLGILSYGVYHIESRPILKEKIKSYFPKLGKKEKERE